MMSKVQTYDIRDSEEYFGVMEIELLLRQNRDKDKDKIELIKLQQASNQVNEYGRILTMA
jgi:hypothetical protein